MHDQARVGRRLETVEQSISLMQMGCKLAHGYYIACLGTPVDYAAIVAGNGEKHS
jgi:hypothetical protein